MDLIRFSIITVCLNSGKCIRETIQSVLDQTTSDYEYIIKDGMSSDETLAIAQSFSEAFSKRGIAYRIISEKDTGIYDAMNQAILETQGEWLLFMNAGDRIADRTVLAQIENDSAIQEADIVYGDMVRWDGQLFLYSKARKLDYFQWGLPFSHQSCYTRRALFKDNMYSTEYRINSDYLFYAKCYREGRRFRYIPIAMSIFDTNGISTDGNLLYHEKLRILENMQPRDEEEIRRMKQTIKRIQCQDLMNKYLWRFVPKSLRNLRRTLKKRKAGWKTAEEFFGTKKDDT